MDKGLKYKRSRLTKKKLSMDRYLHSLFRFQFTKNIMKTSNLGHLKTLMGKSK
jgi:hypothetical protein